MTPRVASACGARQARLAGCSCDHCCASSTKAWRSLAGLDPIERAAVREVYSRWRGTTNGLAVMRLGIDELRALANAELLARVNNLPTRHPQVGHGLPPRRTTSCPQAPSVTVDNVHEHSYEEVA